MKHTYAHLLGSLIMLSTAFSVNAQLIYISAPEVRAQYNLWAPNCVDANGYLDASLPAVQTYDPEYAIMDVNDAPNITIEGLDAFAEVKHLLFAPPDQSVDMTLLAVPPLLEELILDHVGHVTWPTLPSTLKDVRLYDSPMQLPLLPEGLEILVLISLPSVTTLGVLPSTLVDLSLWDLENLTDFGTLPAGLRKLALNGQYMNPVFPDLTGVDLRHFEIWAVLYDSIPALPTSLEFFRLGSMNDLLTYSLPEGLDTLRLHNTYAAPVPALPSTLTCLYYSGVGENDPQPLPELPAGLQELEYYACEVQMLPTLPTSLQQLHIVDCISLACLPPLPEGLQVLELDYTSITCLPNIPSDCLIESWDTDPIVCSILSTVCLADGAELDGQVFHDMDEDGVQDVAEPASSYVMLNVDPIGLVGGVPLDGHFTVELPAGDYTISCAPTSTFVQNIAPATHTASLADLNSTDTGNDFGLTLSPGNDLAVSMMSNVSRPGFNTGVWLNVRNLGTEILDAEVHFTFDTDQSLLNSSVIPTSVVGNTATWTLPAMAMGELRVIYLTLYTSPSTINGTNIDHVVSVDPPSGDVDENNNSYAFHDEVVASCDPNDKTVSPSVLDQSELSTTELTYLIRFQNTGTYHAERVIITDTLSTSLDWNTFRFVASSHTCNWTLFNGVLRFTFEPIFLPDSAADEPGSHGFVTFTIEPMENAGLGMIGNIANIYFDYNQPVITNEAVVEIATGVAEEDADLMRVFPVPAEETLWLERSEGTSVRCAVIDAQGREVFAVQAIGTLVAIPIGTLPAGAYVLRTNSADAPLPFLKR